MSLAAPSPPSSLEARVQVFALFREALWIILLAALVSVILYLPDQIRELYRISIAERQGIGYVLITLPTLLISIMVWLGAKLITTDNRGRLIEPSRALVWTADVLPAGLGAMPIVALAAGIYFALPGPAEGDAIVGSVFEGYHLHLQSELGSLRLYALISAGLAIAFLAAAWRASPASTGLMASANAHYFRTWYFMLATAAVVAGITAAMLRFPIEAALIGVFGILATFMLCVVAMTVHLTLLSREHRWPLVSLILAFAVLLSVLDLNDNHEVRRLEAGPNEASAPRPDAAPRAEEQFHAWYERRPHLAEYSGDYPVYIVAAQGGGIYAAYQTAIFLARMQDVCPAFKHHLFAISSVSGGSLGAAIFTAALRRVEQQGEATRRQASPAADAQAQPPEPSGQAPASGELDDTPAVQAPRPTAAPTEARYDPCPPISRFERSAGFATPPAAGPVEREARRMLSGDLLTPLVGAALFTDFTQRFLPWAFGALDRARALEASFEAAASPEARPASGPLAESFLSHWDPMGGRGPALLLNTTDAATGKRVVIAPFAVGRLAEHRPGALAHFPFWRVTEQGVEIQSPVDIRLSTAAGISARFPWMTPAATVSVVETKTKQASRVRLVDGGYVDNSGVETALDLIGALQGAAASIRADAAAGKRTPAGAAYRPVRLAVIALSGGDYPMRSSFSLGETLEPIRALLSTRQSRAYVALERGALELGRQVHPPNAGAKPAATVEGLRVAKLDSRYYELPLGWLLGDNTRDIIDKQSGRFWECEFNERFEQITPAAAQADCVQMLVFHELNQSLASQMQLVAAASRYRAKGEASFVAGTRLDNQALLACYRERKVPRLALSQARAIQAVLSTWDEHPEWNDDRWLVFILAALARETGGFRIKLENLKYSERSLMLVFGQGRHSAAITPEEAKKLAGDEQAIAERVYGLGNPKGAAGLGNTSPGDGWRYRGRGMLQVTGRTAYRLWGKRVGVDLEAEPDLMALPDVSARAGMLWIVESVRLSERFNSEKEDWAGALRRVTGGSAGLNEVMDQVGVFRACIEMAKRK